MPTPIQFAVVGLGYIGRRHASILSHLPGVNLLAVADPDPDARDYASKHLPGVATYTCCEELLAVHPNLQVVSVCTPNHLHAPCALQALRAGCHVVVEKPIALRRADAEQMLLAAHQAQRHIFGVMQNRYTPAAQWLKQVVDNGTLGKVRFLEINCFWNRDDRYYTPGSWKGRLATDGGTLFTQFSHFIDILYWVFGDITDIHTRLDNLAHQQLTDFEDTGTATFRIVNGGGLGSLNFSTAVWGQNLESSLTVVAEHGSLKIGGQYMNALEYCHIKGCTPPNLAPGPPPNQYAGFQGSANNHPFVFQHVMEVLSGRTSSATNAQDGLMVVDIIERIYAAAEGKSRLL